MLVDAPELSWDQFVDAFLERFVPFSLKDRIWEEFDHMEQGYMIVFEYKVCFHALSRYEFEKIQKL